MKKKVTIGKKMPFSKTTIAQLNTQQQAQIAGGKIFQNTGGIRCQVTTTIIYTQERTCTL